MNERRPDLVTVTGDLISRPRGKEELIGVLARLPDPYIVLGNHDLAISRDPFSRPVDLSGVEVGPVSERDREMAAAELRKGAPKQEREAEARRAADEKYRPTGVNAEKPKLSLRKVTP